MNSNKRDTVPFNVEQLNDMISLYENMLENDWIYAESRAIEYKMKLHMLYETRRLYEQRNGS